MSCMLPYNVHRCHSESQHHMCQGLAGALQVTSSPALSYRQPSRLHSRQVCQCSTLSSSVLLGLRESLPVVNALGPSVRTRDPPVAANSQPGHSYFTKPHEYQHHMWYSKAISDEELRDVGVWTDAGLHVAQKLLASTECVRQRIGCTAAGAF